MFNANRSLGNPSLLCLCHPKCGLLHILYAHMYMRVAVAYMCEVAVCILYTWIFETHVCCCALLHHVCGKLYLYAKKTYIPSWSLYLMYKAPKFF